MNLRRVEREFTSRSIIRGEEIILVGEEPDIEHLERVWGEMILMLNRNDALKPDDAETIIALVKNGTIDETVMHERDQSFESVILYTKHGVIRPKSPGQERFFEATQKNDIVFSIGPSGTGKTYLAVAISIAALRDKLVDRIVLARPAVEAGESLGFLPGDYREKVEPYLRPLYDALYEMIPLDKLKRFIETRVIEIVPLAFMRGRTLNNAFVILDEAQNTTSMQMKMFLTRLGMNSHAIITGDITQIDLPERITSGLVEIREIINNIDGIEFVYLNENDVVRHPLVRKIIIAYDSYNQKRLSQVITN